MRTRWVREASQRVQPDIGRNIPVSAQEDFVIDIKHDLIAVRIPPTLSAFAHAEFINLETEAFTEELNAGISLIVLGAPIASRVSVPGFGEILIPEVEHVRYDPNLDISCMTDDFYSPNNIYMPYSLTQDGNDPHGFSGAAAFVTKEPAPDGVWSVSPQIVGVAQNFARRKGFLTVRKVSTVIDLHNSGSNAF